MCHRNHVKNYLLIRNNILFLHNIRLIILDDILATFFRLLTSLELLLGGAQFEVAVAGETQSGVFSAAPRQSRGKFRGVLCPHRAGRGRGACLSLRLAFHADTNVLAVSTGRAPEKVKDLLCLELRHDAGYDTFLFIE